MALASLSPIYATAGPDEPIRLHQGVLGIEQGDYSGEGNGTLDLVWTSRPKLRFDIPSLTPVGMVQAAECVLTIPLHDAKTPARIVNANLSFGEQGGSVGARGEPNRSVVIGDEVPAQHVIFHVVNFWKFLNPRTENCPPDYDCDRVSFEGGGWRITLQSVPGLQQLDACLRNDSGCGITHVGRAEKVDGSPVTREEALDLFCALHSFLSFARGMWSPPILYVGIDKSGATIWQDWTVRQATPWRVVLTWFPVHAPQSLAGVFPGFMKLWQDLDSQDILQVAIHLYIEANLGTGAIESAVILSQNGIELLTYYILVHERHKLTEKDFSPKGKSAGDRMRQLLVEFGLPTAIGAPRFRINDLPGLAKTHNWKDAPDALVSLRNCIVHPDQRNMERLRNYPIPARVEAWIIGLWYFELILLKWFGYSGNYVNRQTIQFSGDSEIMP